jgi:hypothetical protein
MAIPVLIPAFSTGEIAPNLYGRMDVARTHTAATTMRNMFAAYKGGAYSRPGTRYVGFSAQFGRSRPPRIIPFQFNINQGLILEFGNFYMRVVSNGGFVLEDPIPISDISNTDPGVITAAGSGGSSATPVDTGITASYAGGDNITLDGGSYSVPAVLDVTNTRLLSAALLSPGTDYAPGDAIILGGGTFTTPAQVTVSTTKVASATIAAAGSGGVPGTATVTGTTGTGVKFQASVTINGAGQINAVNSIVNGGSYTANPSVLANEPVTGGGLAGAQLNVTMGVGSFLVLDGGAYTTNAATLTQSSTGGAGSGATFQSPLYGPNSVTFSDTGVYSSLPSNPVGQLSTTGSGFGALFTVSWSSSSASDLNTGDWVFVSGVTGMTQVNGQTYIINVTSSDTFELFDVFGNPVDTTAFDIYTGGGTVARVYTLETQYSDEDLGWLKWTQSADTMTLCCVNQQTETEYPAVDLVRFSNTDWEFQDVVPATSIAPPASVTAAASATGPAYYAYAVTSVAADGSESISSTPADLSLAVDVSATAGSIVVSWSSVAGAQRYNVYKAQPNYVMVPPIGTLFGFAGLGLGNQFIDSNIIADFSQVPPLHQNPFARGQILAGTVTFGGAGYAAGATAVLITSTGSGAVIQPVIVNGSVAALLVVTPGQDYQPGDGVAIIGAGSGAAGTITVGAESGTYPGVPGYFQQRRVFGYTLNNPNTYFMSQPGAFRNFDFRIPTIDSDAITGSPWSLQVNGLQWLLLMPAGLAIFTGVSAWLLVGSGSFATNVAPISPSNQTATPLAFSGCSATLPPIKVNYDIIYVSSKGDYYYDLPYQLYALSEPIDLTNFSSQLFDQYTFREHTWAEVPFKLLWTVRSDGVLLSLTYLKQQNVMGWTRHDTNGRFWSIASVVEPIIASRELANDPVQNADAVYFVTERAA